MARAITSLKSLPGSAQSTAATLAALGFPEGRWHYVSEYPLAAPDKKVQVRNIRQTAPPKKVAHYMEVMRPFTKDRSGLVMPPVIYSQDGHLLDGNTRDAAARKLGWTTYPAIILEDNYKDAPQAIEDMFRTVSVRFNRINGEPLSNDDLEQHILALARPGDSPTDLSRRLQVPLTMVKNVLAARSAKGKLKELGIDLSDYPHIHRTHFSYIGYKLGVWHDEPLRAFAELLKLKVPANDAYTMQKRFLALPSDEEILKAIQVEHASRADISKGYVTRPSRSAQLRQHLGFVIKYTPGDLVESIPGSENQHLEVLRDAIIRLQRIRDEQERLVARRQAAQEEEATDEG
jgi:hypothetical protein